MSNDANPSPFWTFSLRYYRGGGVPEACLDLQDRGGADVNVVLFLLWMATRKRRFPADAVRALADAVQPWQSAVVAPIRALRRSLKAAPALVDKGAAEAFRTRIKAIELESERLQQDAMAALGERLPTEAAASIEEAARANIAAYEAWLGRSFTPAAVETLVAALR
jgi:uncharacterized protein (TIGR02444 family)